MSFGPEWFVVLGVIVLLFGAKKLPELARSLGRSTSEFKQGMKDGADSADEPTSQPPAQPQVQQPAQPQVQQPAQPPETTPQA